MGTSSRWLLLLVLVVVVAGVAFLLVEDGGDDGRAAPSVVTPRDGSRTGTATPPPLAGASDPSTPEALAPSAAPDVPVDATLVPLDGAEEEPGPRVVVTGRLLSRDGRPVEGALVALSDGMAPAIATMAFRQIDMPDGAEIEWGIGRDRSDAEGRFRIDAPLPDDADDELPAIVGDLMGDARLLVQHPGFVSDEYPLPPLHEGEVDAGDLVLDPAGRIVGRVLGRDGVVGGAVLAVRPRDQRAAGLGDMLSMVLGGADQALTSGESGDDGRFVLGGVRPGAYDLAVHGAGHPLTVVGDVDVEPGLVTDVGDVALPDGAVVAGVVVDGEGDPVPELRVEATAEQGSGMDALETLSLRLLVGDLQTRTDTDARGRFLFDGLSTARHEVSAGGDDTGWSRATTTVDAGRRDVRLVVHRLGGLLVTVVGAADGSPLAGAELDAERVDDEEHLETVPWDAAADAPLDEDAPGTGVFLVAGAGREGTELVVRAEGHATSRTRAPAVVGDARQAFTVLLERESLVEGVVVDDRGATLPGATVTARVPGADDGGLDIGSGDVRMSSSARVTTRPDGSPALEAVAGGETLEAVADDDGRFRLERLGAGAWELVATADGHVPGEPLALTLAAGEHVEDLELVAPAGGAVVGVVTESDGAPVRGARVQVARVLPGLALGPDGIQERLARDLAASFGAGTDEVRSVKTGADGRYEVLGLRPGDYDVTLRKQSASPISLNIGSILGVPSDDDGRTKRTAVAAREESRVDFVREGLGRLRARVTAGGRPVEGADVSVGDAGNSLFGLDLSLSGRIERTDADGLVDFGELEPGAYKLTASAPGAAHTVEVEVELAARADEEVELAFGGTTLAGRVLDDRVGVGAAGVPVTVVRLPDEPEQEDDEGGGGFLSGLLGGGNVSITVSDGNSTRTSSGPAASSLFGVSGTPAVTDAEGRFVLRHLSPGRWQVDAGGGPWIPGEPETVRLGDTGVPDRVTLHVRRGATLHGQVVEGSSEEPLDGVTVELRTPAGKRERSTNASGGRYAFEGVPAGDWVVAVEGDDGDRAERAVHVGADDLDVTTHLVTLD